MWGVITYTLLQVVTLTQIGPCLRKERIASPNTSCKASSCMYSLTSNLTWGRWALALYLGRKKIYKGQFYGLETDKGRRQNS